MNPWAAFILGALLALMLRALIPLLWRAGSGGTARGCDEDIGDAGSGDIRISIFEHERRRK